MVFKEQAKSDDNAAWCWFCATVGMTILTASFAIGLFCAYLSGKLPTSATEGFQVGVASLAFFSVLYFALLWCGRMHKARRHNTTMNYHRHNALTTFEAFSENANDPQVKDAVLAQAAAAIFTPQATGYDQGKGGDSPGTAQVFEIFRAIGKDGG